MDDLRNAVIARKIELIKGHVEERANLLNTAKKHAVDESVFEEHEPFFFAGEISSNRLDAYHTTMDPKTSLRNYARNASAGVSFQNSHRHMELPLARTISGKREKVDEQFEINDETFDVWRVVADMYTIRGIDLNGVRTDDFIAGIQSGIASDMSIGFFGGFWRCRLCDKDMRDWWECSHIPGFTYEVEGDEAKSKRNLLATANIENAELTEVSAVYDGATPGAGVIDTERVIEAKAERLVTEGLVKSPKMETLIRRRFRIAPATRSAVVGAEIKTKEDISQMPPEDTNDDLLAPIRALLRTGPDKGIEGIPADPLRAVTWLMDRHVELSTQASEQDDENERLTAELGVLKPQAEDGKRYRVALIDLALQQGVRAFGDFDAEAKRTMLESMDLVDVRQLLASWEEIGNARFPAGRGTTDDPPPADSWEFVDPPTPNAAHG